MHLPVLVETEAVLVILVAVDEVDNVLANVVGELCSQVVSVRSGKDRA